MTSPISNPIGYLQEFVQKYNVAPFPKYEECGVSGPDHSRQFTYKCIYDGFEVSSSSQTKRQAKTEAAQKMVTLLQSNGYFDKYNHTVKDLVITPKTNTLNTNLDNKGNMNKSPVVECLKNPISLLQEYCQRSRTQLPKYTEGVEVGGHFICECVMDGKNTFGQGICKKTAKTEAAYKMCEILNLLSTTTKHSHMELNVKENVSSKYESKVKDPPLPVEEISQTLIEFNLNGDEEDAPVNETSAGAGDILNGTPVETLSLNDSVVEIEPISDMKTRCKTEVQDVQTTLLEE